MGNAFQTANNLPNVIYMLIAGGVLNSVLVPQIVKAMRLPDGGREYTDRIITLSTAGMLVVTVACTAAAAGWFVHLYAGSSARRDRAGRLLRGADDAADLLLRPVRGARPGAERAQPVRRLRLGAGRGQRPVDHRAAGVHALYDGHVRPGEWTRRWSGCSRGRPRSAWSPKPSCSSSPCGGAGSGWQPRFGIRGVGLRTTSKVAVWAFVSLVASQLVYLLVSNIIWHASKQATPNEFIAGISVYTTAFFVFMVPHAFVTLSVITALYPRMSSAVHDGDQERPRHEYRRGLAMPTVLTIPATFALAVFAVPIVALLFASQNPQEIPATALVLAVMAPGIVPFGIDVLNQRFFYAHDDGRMVFYEQPCRCRPPASPSRRCGSGRSSPSRSVAGLVISNILSAAFGMWFVRRRTGRIGFTAVLSSWARLVVSSVVASGLAFLATVPLRDPLPSRLVALAELAVGGLVFAVVYVGLALLMRVPEIGEMLAPVVRRLPGGRPRGRHARG